MDVKLPNLGEGADTGTVVNLFVKEGDQIQKDQPILELENEKAVASIPSTAAGVVSKIYVKPGDKIGVGARLIAITEAGGAPATSAPAAAPKKESAAKPRSSGRRTGGRSSRRRARQKLKLLRTAKSPPLLPFARWRRNWASIWAKSAVPRAAAASLFPMCALISRN